VRVVRSRLLKIGKRSAAVSAFCQKLRDLVRSDDGPTATEYAILLAVICVAVIGALSTFGVHMDRIYTSIAGTMPSGGL
jgi:pilus assembly protein Flp/PilA